MGARDMLPSSPMAPLRAYPIEDVDLSGVEPYDTPIWDELLAEMVPEDQREMFPFDHEDDDDRVKGNDSDDDGADERDDTPDEDPPAEEG